MPYRLPNGDWSDEPMDLNGFSYYVDSTTYNAILSVDNAMDVVLTPDAYIVGKAPPVPPLDKPQIYWVYWNPDDHMANAFVSDYFAVKEVWLVSQASGTLKMEYDTNLGYYTKELGSLTNGVDYIYAVNRADAQSDNVYIQEIAEPPDLSPEISGAFYEILEDPSGLRARSQATITDNQSLITEVQLLDYLDVLIGPMTKYVGTDTYYYAEDIDPDFQPPPMVKIRAFNELGKSTTVSIHEPDYIYPRKQYTSKLGYCPLAPNYPTDPGFIGWKYWDLDFPSSEIDRTPHSEYDSLPHWHYSFDYDITAQTGYYDDDDNWIDNQSLWLANPLLKWTAVFGDYNVPFSKEDIELLWEQHKADANTMPLIVHSNIILLMITGEGRLAYIVFPPYIPGFVTVSKMGAYSLYNGPYRVE